MTKPKFKSDNPLASLPPEMFVGHYDGKFKPKMTFDERCAVLALEKQRVNKVILAAAFGVDRRTITHICNDASSHYRDVRKKLKEMGLDDFTREYVTAEAVERVRTAVIQPLPGVDEAPLLPSSAGVPNPRKRSKAGIHTVKPDQCSYSHRLEIEYIVDYDAITGWFYRDLDSKNPDQWLHNGTASLETSQACLSFAIENLIDD